MADITTANEQENAPLNPDDMTGNKKPEHATTNGHLADQETTSLTSGLAKSSSGLPRSTEVISGSQNLRSTSQVQVEQDKSCIRLLYEPFLTIIKGWKTYLRQKIVYAGLSLAFLYMTVLGFDAVTIGACVWKN